MPGTSNGDASTTWPLTEQAKTHRLIGISLGSKKRRIAATGVLMALVGNASNRCRLPRGREPLKVSLSREDVDAACSLAFAARRHNRRPVWERGRCPPNTGLPMWAGICDV